MLVEELGLFEIGVLLAEEVLGGRICEGARIPLLGVPAATAACKFAAVGIIPADDRFFKGIGGRAVVGGPTDGLEGRGSVAAIAFLLIVCCSRAIDYIKFCYAADELPPLSVGIEQPKVHETRDEDGPETT